MNTLLIYIASVLHVFNITPGTDSVGQPIELSSTDYFGGISVYVKLSLL